MGGGPLPGCGGPWPPGEEAGGGPEVGGPPGVAGLPPGGKLPGGGPGALLLPGGGIPAPPAWLLGV